MKKRVSTNSKRNSNKANANQVYVDFLRFGNPTSRAGVLRGAPPCVIRTICNAANNAAKNPKIRLSTAQRKVLARYRRQISVLIARASLKKKRAALQTGGALPFLPVLLGSALAALGAHLFSK